MAKDSTAVMDVALAAELTTVAGLWRQAGEAGDRLVVQLTDLGHFDEHRDGSQRADTRDRDEDLEALHRLGFAA